jgi:hypothetical protein
MTVIVPDALNDIRYWLRHNTDILAYTASRTFYRIPASPQFPLQRIYRTGGGIRQTGGGAALQDVLVSVECWHNQDSGYQTLRQMVAATESAIWQIPSRTVINPGGNTRVVDAVVSNVIDSPDPDSGWPRFILDTRWSVIATTQ